MAAEIKKLVHFFFIDLVDPIGVDILGWESSSTRCFR